MRLAPTRILEGGARGGSGAFTVGSMFTPNYVARAEELRASCERHGLAYRICEFPAVHWSLAPGGSLDPRLTKPSVIQYLLDELRRPILWIDADCVVQAYPQLIDGLLGRGVDFAIYNWLADAGNDAFFPVDVRIGGEILTGRFFAFSHRVSRTSSDQLLCSGCVQLHAPTVPDAALLAGWQASIERNPRVVDDFSLDFCFNNLTPGALRPSWLPQEYARYPWWLLSEPVLEHPDYPREREMLKLVPDREGLERLYGERCTPTRSRFPENAIIDVVRGVLYVLDGDRMSAPRPLGSRLYPPAQIRASQVIDVAAIEGYSR